MAVKLCALFVIILFADVNCKVQKRALTESMGQEVIEMASPDKELPADLEEEPSAESFEAKSTSTTIGAATKNVPAKSITSRRMNAAKDEESRIEKELAELYKDPDYKDSGEVNKTDGRKSASNVKPAQRTELKLHPEVYSEPEMARFRTQTDRIVCTTDRRTTKTLGKVEPKQRIMNINTPDKKKKASSATTATISLSLLPVMVLL
ncbi:uncharacterized protein LOC121736580 [Aricia agestis]|uniref:uncharacterized protein LOC121736580 n=1 Tax=Aricia agestis TaxID=91739 RepID=UPI001C20182F|nr:uncharacterized protein LOC121736580 [Aricia agestis]